MAIRCPNCSRANPAEAQFCFFDGAVLSQGTQGPLKAGTVPFPGPFVFPDGLACSNFNQLALGCQKQWNAAREFVKQGFFTGFLKGLGRFDLAKIADQAAGQDPDQGLDSLLSKLPSEIMQPPKLMVEPTNINLGQLKPGSDHRFEMTLINQGMRLLSGAVSVDCDWLTLGDGVGTSQSLFQTPIEAHIPLRVLGKHLRASNKPLESVVTIESNGGVATLTVRAEAPITPFPMGIFAGATTPREIAVRAKRQPKEAAALFETGNVEAWYRTNGWEYPVQGPAGSGLGAVQQFFEALGLVKAPVVEMDTKQVLLSGIGGSSLQFNLKVRSAEKKPVFAHALSNQPWLQAKPPQFSGNIVTLPLEIPMLPNVPQQTLRALLTVRANGNQRFLVPVLVEVRPSPTAKAATFELTSLSPIAPPPPQPAANFPSQPSPPPATGSTSDGAFGMGRLIYWSGLLGGWSAFGAWLLSELLIGRWVGDSLFVLLLMVTAIGSAIGGGLSLLSVLSTGQWQGLWPKIKIGLMCGAVAGFVGSLLGSVLFTLLGTRSATLGLVGRTLGWTLMGLSIGMGEGLFHRDRIKIRNGLIGGTLGGFLGGLLFNPVSSLVGSPLSSRALGFVVLGFCVGLFIGLVNILLKEGWLTVIAGFRPGRQLILSQQSTTLGTSEKANLIFIAYGSKGVEPLHLNIERTPQGTYRVDDNQSRTGTFINGTQILGPTPLRDGDIIQLGINQVRFNERLRPKINNDQG